ncbi:MAG: hypothetical protein VKS61_05110 [Candidatus Sericytochromatia bacterium]|nr:hypothetical protein [Candidatus Sericytochromatia bacterium]MEB3221438.1 hypothetical protein [Candidatus Sericytochromatia bacterium]
MAREATSTDVLKTLKEALDASLRDVDATVEYHYSGAERGSLSIIREGKALQTSYFASFEIQALRDGGAAALDKQKQTLLDQVQRLLNPPKPQPISLTSVLPARRGRAGARAKAAVEGETGPETAEEGGEEE